MLKRTELRELVKSILMNKTLAGPRVYDSLPYPVDKDDCPCILIYTPTDNATSRAGHTALLESSLTIAIEVRVYEVFKTSARTLDHIVEAVEDLVLSNETFQSHIESVSSFNTQTGQEDGGQLPFSIAILSITVEYKREIIAKPDGYYLFATLDVDAIDPSDPNEATPGPDGRIEATIDVVVPQN